MNDQAKKKQRKRTKKSEKNIIEPIEELLKLVTIANASFQLMFDQFNHEVANKSNHFSYSQLSHIALTNFLKRIKIVFSTDGICDDEIQPSLFHRNEFVHTLINLLFVDYIQCICHHSPCWHSSSTCSFIFFSLNNFVFSLDIFYWIIELLQYHIFVIYRFSLCAFWKYELLKIERCYLQSLYKYSM